MQKARVRVLFTSLAALALAHVGTARAGSSDGRNAPPPPSIDAFHGELDQSVPILVPPYHGLEPKLAITYRSARGNGFAGVGGDLEGAPRIRRASPGGGAPRYDATDVYLLDGQELVPCVAGSVSPSCTTGTGTTYQYFSTKIESYQRIGYAAATDTWALWRTDGTVTTFSAIQKPPQPLVSCTLPAGCAFETNPAFRSTTEPGSCPHCTGGSCSAADCGVSPTARTMSADGITIQQSYCQVTTYGSFYCGSTAPSRHLEFGGGLSIVSSTGNVPTYPVWAVSDVSQAQQHLYGQPVTPVDATNQIAFTSYSHTTGSYLLGGSSYSWSSPLAFANVTSVDRSVGDCGVWTIAGGTVSFDLTAMAWYTSEATKSLLSVAPSNALEFMVWGFPPKDGTVAQTPLANVSDYLSPSANTLTLNAGGICGGYATVPNDVIVEGNYCPPSRGSATLTFRGCPATCTAGTPLARTYQWGVTSVADTRGNAVTSPFKVTSSEILRADAPSTHDRCPRTSSSSGRASSDLAGGASASRAERAPPTSPTASRV